MAGKKTLLISLDLRRPKIHRIFNLDNTEGISTYLIGRATQEEIIQETNINNLYIANSGPVPPNPAELMGSEKMKEFITHCRKNFDCILIDTPPAAIVTDAIALKDSIDSFVFVVRHNYTNNHVVQFINELYEKQTLRHIGVVVNDIVISGYYGYSYRYGYGYGYGYGAQYSQYDDYVEKTAKRNIFQEIRRIFGMKGQ
jgi:capsular exopolysaccharide synthesis family protein